MLILCVYFEARGENEQARVAVGHVIMNRVAKADISVKQVVEKPYQFSWLNNPVQPHIKDYTALVNCAVSVFKMYKERLEGKDLQGADHYYDDSIKPPYWAKDMKPLGKIDSFFFFKS